MINNNSSNNFERSRYQVLPPKAINIINSVASKYIRKCRNQDTVTRHKQIEVAHAVLHMRMYQKLGPDSQNFMTHAYQILEELLNPSEESDPSPAVQGRLVPSGTT